MIRLLLRLVPLLCLAEAATAAEGRFTYVNETGEVLERVRLAGEWDEPPPAALAPGASETATIRFPDRGVIVNAAAWQGPNGEPVCSLRIQTERDVHFCRPVAVVTQGTGGRCDYRFEVRDNRSCDFWVVFSIAGD